MDKQNAVSTYNGIYDLFSFNKVGHFDTWYNTGKLRGRDAQWNKPVTKKTSTAEFHLYEVLKSS